MGAKDYLSCWNHNSDRMYKKKHISLISKFTRRSISTSDLFSRPNLEESEQSSCLVANSSPHKLDPVLEEEKKGEEEKEEEEEEIEEEEGAKGEKNKGNGWKGKEEEEEEGEISTFCESRKPSEIQGKPSNAAEVLVGGVENAEVQKENNVNPHSAESSELEKKSRLCTGAGAEVEVHR